MKMMDKARIRVDFNELVQPDLVLLAKSDLVVDSRGTAILLTERLPVSVYEYNDYAEGEQEYLLADGLVELNRLLKKEILSHKSGNSPVKPEAICHLFGQKFNFRLNSKHFHAAF